MFSEWKEKTQKITRELTHYDYLSNITKSMFNYDINYDMQYSLRQEFIEEILQSEGKCALINIDGYYYACTCKFTGDLNPNGFLNDVNVFTKNGKTFYFEDWYHNKNVTILFNDNNYAPDFYCDIFADYLTKVDVSLKLAIQNTRIKPIPIVKNQSQKNVVDEVLKATDDGIYKTILNDDFLADITENPSINVLNITDPKYSETIQYLSKIRDDVFRWFFGIYGLGMNGSGKIAQQTNAEISLNDESKMTLPFIMLEMRKKGLKMFKNKTGIDIKVDFSHCWKRHLELEKENVSRETSERGDNDDSN